MEGAGGVNDGHMHAVHLLHLLLHDDCVSFVSTHPSPNK